MLQLLAAPLSLVAGGDASGTLAAADVELLRELEALMPAGPRPLSGERLVTAEGLPYLQWLPSQLVERPVAAGGTAGGATASRPAVRRAADAVLEELRKYFEVHHGVRTPNARTVFGGQLATWTAESREREPTLEAVHWWCDFLCLIEDKRPFTKSNWATASAFEDALSHCRLVLVSMRGKLEDSERHGLEGLREALHSAHSINRDVADKLLELLYTALRPQPAIARCCFHDLEDLASNAGTAGVAFRAPEDQLVLIILQLEQAQAVDFLATAFLCCSQDCDDTIALPAPVVSSLHEAQELACQLRTYWSRAAELPTSRVPASAVHALGSQAVNSFLDLCGHYCLYAGLLGRLDLLLRAVQDYARFVCFLPVHEAAILDLEVLLPQLRLKIIAAVERLSSAYECLPRAVAPQGRSAVLDKCKQILQHLKQTTTVTTSALAALRACSPMSTLRDFDGWRSEDHRWLQVARLNLAARALLPATEVEALAVSQLSQRLRLGGRAPKLQLSLQDAGQEGADPLQEGTVAIAPRASPGDAGNLASTGLSKLVDEDTRLYVAGQNICTFGSQVCSVTADGCTRASQVVLEQVCEHMPEREAVRAAAEDTASHAAGLIVEFLGQRLSKQGVARTLPEGEWTFIEQLDGSAVHPPSRDVESLSPLALQSGSPQAEHALISCANCS